LRDAFSAPAREAFIDGFVRTVFFAAILPAATNLQNMHYSAQNAAIVRESGTGLVNRRVRYDMRPLRIAEQKQVRIQVRVHGSSPE
jgi:hypothetical protein